MSTCACEPAAAASCVEPTADAAGKCAVPACSEEDAQTEVGHVPARDAESRGQGTVKSSEAGELRILPEIMRLRMEQKALQDQRKQIQKDLKNAEKRRSRLKKRARQLTDEDLLAVFQLRKQEMDAKREKAASAAASSGSPSGAEGCAP